MEQRVVTRRMYLGLEEVRSYLWERKHTELFSSFDESFAVGLCFMAAALIHAKLFWGRIL